MYRNHAFNYSTTTCLRNVRVCGVPPAGSFFLFLLLLLLLSLSPSSKMVSEIFPVVASDQYTDKNSSLSSLHLGPSPSIISKRQLPVSSTIVMYTLQD